MTTTVRPADLTALRQEHPGTRLLDVRTPGEFAAAHIEGSYNVPLPDLAEHRAELAGSTDPVVLICQSGMRASKAEEQLTAAGLNHIHVLDGGVNAWKAAGLPTLKAEGKAKWELERQVRLVAGGIVAASIVASVWVPEARFVGGAVGAGLVFAAVTNTCAMGMALMKLPYNRSNTATCDMPTVAGALTAK